MVPWWAVTPLLESHSPICITVIAPGPVTVRARVGGGSFRGWSVFLVLKAQGAVCPPRAPCFPCSLCLASWPLGALGFPGKGSKHFKSSKLVQTKGSLVYVWSVVGHLGAELSCISCDVLYLRSSPWDPTNEGQGALERQEEFLHCIAFITFDPLF